MTDESTPRAYTADEVRDKIIEHVWASVHSWADNPGSCADKLSGLAFSIFAMLDGASMNLPAFKLVPDPHPDDEEFHRNEGENWYSSETPVVDMLHEHFYSERLRQDYWRRKPMNLDACVCPNEDCPDYQCTVDTYTDPPSCPTCAYPLIRLT